MSYGDELADSIREAEATIREPEQRLKLSKREVRRLELAYALRDHRQSISRQELRAKIRAGWR